MSKRSQRAAAGDRPKVERPQPPKDEDKVREQKEDGVTPLSIEEALGGWGLEKERKKK
jgi:hypothetical protein